MKLSEPLIKKLSQKYLPSTMIEMAYKGNDLSFKTDENGNAILLFIGKRNARWKYKGRTLCPHPEI